MGADDWQNYLPKGAMYPGDIKKQIDKLNKQIIENQNKMGSNSIVIKYKGPIPQPVDLDKLRGDAVTTNFSNFGQEDEDNNE